MPVLLFSITKRGQELILVDRRALPRLAYDIPVVIKQIRRSVQNLQGAKAKTSVSVMEDVHAMLEAGQRYNSKQRE